MGAFHSNAQKTFVFPIYNNDTHIQTQLPPVFELVPLTDEYDIWINQITVLCQKRPSISVVPPPKSKNVPIFFFFYCLIIIKGKYNFFHGQNESIWERFWSNWLHARHMTTFPSILTFDVDGEGFLTQNGNFVYSNVTLVNS